MRAMVAIPVVLAWIGAAALPLAAHHAFSVEFDLKQRVTLKGQVTKIEWTNPHTYFYVDVREGSGRVVNWVFEAAGPNTLTHLGWDRKSMKVGDQVTVTGYRARDASNIASAREVVLADGRKVLAGSTVDGGPQR
ncbi:MAG TPA: DUF6152 family protein [Bryobacteraceae bacterium]|nr:DUF6152 family protein [Bryobacteraceae bacterium]